MASSLSSYVFVREFIRVEVEAEVEVGVEVEAEAEVEVEVEVDTGGWVGGKKQVIQVCGQ